MSHLLVSPWLLGGPTQYCVMGVGGLGFGYEQMNETHLSVFTPSLMALAESARETASLPRLAILSNRFFKSRAREFTTFTLHDLSVFSRRKGDSAALQ